MKTAFFVLFIFTLSQFVIAQTSINGKITDSQNGELLAGASVYVLELNKSTSSNSDGQYFLAGLKKGIYKIHVSFLGYQSALKELVIAEIGTDKTFDISLTASPIQINEVVVSSAYVNSQRENTYKIDVVHSDEMQRTGAITVMDIIEKVPGVDAITTGPLVSRPVIHGLSGNRVLTVVDGTRFETQQWDDEHGIGVNELGLDRIEIIKGPASLLYGPEAMGGVVNFIQERPAPLNTKESEAVAGVYSNNLGFHANVKVKGSKEDFNWGVNALGRLLSDYFYDGYGFRVPNTRLLEYGGKGYLGINGEWGSSTLSYVFNKAYYGILDGKDIIKDERGQIINIDSLEKEKFPFEIEAPFHAVTDNRINSKTTFLTGKSRVEAVLGYQNNHRSENEELSGAKKGYTYLDMVLQSGTYDLKWFLPKWNNFETIIGSQGMHQKNKNKTGTETQLIPDAIINDIGLLALTKYRIGDFSASLGGRYDTRHLQSEEAMDPSLDMPAIKREYYNVSSSVGVSYLIANSVLLRASYASGYRPPNLNELLSNGVKLDSQRFERGNVDFKKETNHELDLNVGYTHKDFTIEAAAFFNKIRNYLYIAPTGNEVASNLDPTEFYPEYQFLQSNAEIRGGEVGLNIHPMIIPWTHFETKFSTLKATRNDDGSYLPMMPATKLSHTLFFNFKHVNRFEDLFFDIGIVTTFDQDQVADSEEKTPGYTLLNAALGARIRHTEVTLTAHNILDKAYLDHLSRFRSFDIIEPGLNISLSVRMPIDFLF